MPQQNDRPVAQVPGDLMALLDELAADTLPLEGRQD